MTNLKIDLSILKRLVLELENGLEHAQQLKAKDADKIEYIVEFNKASGLAAGIMAESALLMGDIQQIVQGGPAVMPHKTDILSMMGLKGSGSSN